MTKKEVFEIYDDNYSYTEDLRDYEYKNTVEYGYDIERKGDYYNLTYPYPENELTEAYDKIYQIRKFIQAKAYWMKIHGKRKKVQYGLQSK